MSIHDVPGARLYYETIGDGPPLVLIPGGNGTAHIFGPIVQHLAEHYRVTTYDRRGFARSRLDGAQDYGRRLQTDAEDALAMVELVAAEPASVFGPSSGAIVGLQAVTKHPDLIDRVVAYEPPALKQLPDARRWLDLCDEVYDLYQQAGIAPALDRFNEPFFPPEDVAFLGLLRDVSIPEVRAAVEFWFEQELRQYTAVDLDLDALRAHADRVTIAVGRSSRGFPLHDIATTLATALGQEPSELPGGHTGYAGHAAEFAPALMGLLASSPGPEPVQPIGAPLGLVEAVAVQGSRRTR